MASENLGQILIDAEVVTDVGSLRELLAGGQVIYNINSARELHDHSINDTDGPSDLMLFEIGVGGTGIEAIGPNRTHYAHADMVDMFVTPRVARRLRDALDAIEVARAGEGQRRQAQ